MTELNFIAYSISSANISNKRIWRLTMTMLIRRLRKQKSPSSFKPGPSRQGGARRVSKARRAGGRATVP
jgi:hypothetical protein